MVIIFPFGLALLLGLAVVSPVFRTTLENWIIASANNAAAAATNAYMLIRRITVITMACTILAISIAADIHSWGTAFAWMFGAAVLCLIAFLLIGEVTQERFWITVAGGTGLAVVGMLVALFTPAWIGSLFAIFAAAGAITLGSICFGIHRGLRGVATGTPGTLIHRLRSMGALTSFALTSLFGGWALAMFSIAVLLIANSTLGTSVPVVRTVGLFVLGGLIAYSARLVHSTSMKWLAGAMEFAILAILVYTFVPENWKKIGGNLHDRTEVAETRIIQKTAVTGRVYYTLKQNVDAFDCNGICESAGNDSVRVNIPADGKADVRTFETGDQFVTFRRKLVTINGILWVAVHPRRREAALGYDIHRIYLIPKDAVVESSADPTIDPVVKATPVIAASNPAPAPVQQVEQPRTFVVYKTIEVPTPPRVDSFPVELPASGEAVDLERDTDPGQNISCMLTGQIEFLNPDERYGRTQSYSVPIGVGYPPTILAEGHYYPSNRVNTPVGAALFQVGNRVAAYHDGFRINGGGHLWAFVNVRKKDTNSGSYHGMCYIRG